ncbi:uncharacterized protein [Littorina saxatilis]|uniref:uncharacterized protein isoform X2 n=1 Tax=Littorina saxatilis TaxID=31220 RepID=UPI0038B6897E
MTQMRKEYLEWKLCSDVLADFMGHDVRIHREFYRLPQQMYQVTKVAKLLLALEKGDLATIRGKTLDDTTSQFPLTTFWMMKTTAIMMKRAPQPFRQHHSSNKSLDLALVLQGVHVMGILIINMLLIKDLALVLQGVHVMGILILNMLLIKDLALVLQGVHVMGILIINMFLIKGLWPEKRRRCHKLKLP